MKALRIFLALFFFSLNISAEECETSACFNEKLSDNYEELDNYLNSSYKTLTKQLNAEKKKILKTVQLKWIARRDCVCGEAEEKFCPNGFCENGLQILGSANARLGCLITFTENRTQELIQATDQIKKGTSPAFNFREPSKYSTYCR